MMLARLRSFTKLFPLILISILVALAVWILAVTSSDPSETMDYPRNVPIEIIGQSTNLVLTNELPESITITLRAPNSIWETLNEDPGKVRAFIDLSSVAAGETSVPVQVQVSIKPVEIVSFTPQQVNVVMEPLSSKPYDIVVVTRGALPVGYQSDEPQLSETTAMVSGAESRVAQVAEVHAVVDLTQVRSDINTTITLQPVDANGLTVRDVTVTPSEITLLQTITQRGGYRNVVVIVVTEGQVRQGYRLSSITVNPPTVTVYSTDAAAVDALPGSIETKVVSLVDQQEDFTQTVELNLPANLQVLGSSEVEVKVNIEPVVSSIALSDIPVIESGLATNLVATFLPEKANIIITGPLPVLESIFVSDVRILVDLTGYLPGTYSITNPVLSLNIPGLTIESISPNTFEVTIVPGN
jgi:YbbR domain-containing protein